MKAILLLCHDGARHLAMVVAADFDTQAWANSRRAAFALLRVVRVIEDSNSAFRIFSKKEG